MSSSILTNLNSAAPSRAGSVASDAGKPRWSRQVAIDIVALLDVAAIVAAVALSAPVQSVVGELAVRTTGLVQAGLITAIIMHACLRNAGMYSTDALADLPIRPLTLAGCLLLSLAAVLGLGMPGRIGEAQFWLWSATWVAAAFALLLVNRVLARRVLARLTALGRFDTRIAVFGAGGIARRVHDHLVGARQGIRFVGVYDDRCDEDRLNPEGLPVAGRLDDLVNAARDGAVDRIIIALPAQADRRIDVVTRRLEHLPISLHIATHVASDLVEAGSAHRVSNLGAVGLLDIKARPLADWAPIVKRAEDLVFAGVLFALALPLMVVIALVVKLESRGPVLFAQRRRGLDQRVFTVLKFRTMNVMQDGADAPQATARDPRVTRVGWLLRRASLDELPQLWNVLRGDMSLVGPRPHALVHDDQWGEMLERYANRHQVKPGITGLAQVRGYRGEADSIEKIELRVAGDLEYIATWSLWLDLSIMVRTVGIVLSARNAH